MCHTLYKEKNSLYQNISKASFITFMPYKTNIYKTSNCFVVQSKREKSVRNGSHI